MALFFTKDRCQAKSRVAPYCRYGSEDVLTTAG
jgi:hypothetical protein